MGAAASPLAELDAAARASHILSLAAEFDIPGGKAVQANVYAYDSNHGMLVNSNFWEVTKSGSTQNPQHTRQKSVAAALRHLTATHPKAVVRPDSVKVSVTKGATTAAKLKPVFVQALHEALGLPVPTLDELKASAKASKAAKQDADAGLAELLRAGPDGVTQFNKLPARERSKADLRKADLSNLDLSGVKFGGAKLDEADLSGTILTGAEFTGTGRNQYGRSSLKGTKFAGADLSGVQLAGHPLADADFTGAKLAGAKLWGNTLKRVTFAGADLTAAELHHADLAGADFTGATLTDAQFDNARFDEHTKWPKGFLIPHDLTWKGVGADPRFAPSKKEKKRPPPTDFADFLDRLGKSTDAAKLKKATQMLKADRFRLFAKVTDDHLVGVVKSQSDGELVYSCKLTSGGDYACCTQNLNVCGGLRGSPCKHLLVLIVGLTKAGELDPATAHAWSQASRGKKFALDKDAMTETLLQYKGAEAGEVDWRPTETIPEDFYAM